MDARPDELTRHALLVRILEAAMATQEQVDALTAQVTAATNAVVVGVAAIRQDIADLRAANPALDTSALEASVTALGSAAAAVTELDAENPPPGP